MPNKKQIIWILCLLLCFIMVFSRCNKPTTIKDLDECMIDLKVYQENMGDQIKQGNLKDAEWLLHGTDSLLRVMSNTFPEHRKLDKPFSYFYNKKLKKPLGNIQEAITKNDTALAMKNYRILVRRCNSCHFDHDVDKKVKF